MQSNHIIKKNNDFLTNHTTKTTIQMTPKKQKNLGKGEGMQRPTCTIGGLTGRIPRIHLLE